MNAQLLPWWRKLTRRRHESELRALRTARAFAPLAIFPIFLTVGFWWFALCIPSLVPYVIGRFLSDFDSGTTKVIGYALLVLTHVYAFIALCLTAPWFFRWYFIAAGLMLGRTATADRKQAELVASLAGNGLVSPAG